MNDLLTTDNNNEEEGTGVYTPNKEDAQRINNFLDNRQNNQPAGKNVSSGGEGSTPSGKDVSSSSMETGGSKVPQGNDLSNALNEGSGNMAQGGAELEKANEAAAEAGKAMLEAGEKAGELAEVGAEGGTVAAEGGAAVVAGAPTAGIGAAVVVAISVATGVISAGVKGIKKALATMDNKKDSSIGTVPTALLIALFCLVIFICLFIIPILTPSSVFAGVVDWAKEQLHGATSTVSGKMLSLEDKGKFFKDLFVSEGFDLSDADLYDTVTTQKQLDENNIKIYEAIVDEGIRLSYDKYVAEFTRNPKVIINSLFGWVTGYSTKVARAELEKKEYYYAFKKDNGTAYTVGEYLNDPSSITNNDINYAEIITVFSQGEDNVYYAMSYSDFYDKLVGNPDTPHVFFEMELNSTPTYFYWNDANHDSYTLCDESTAKSHATAAQGLWDTITSVLSGDDSDSDDDDSSDDDTFSPPSDYDPDTNPTDEEAADGKYGWGYFYDFNLYPYGLFDIYRCAGINMDAPSYINPQFSNIETLDTQEGYLRMYLGDSTYLGPSGLEERKSPSGTNLQSTWKKLYDSKGLDFTGRTATAWCESQLNIEMLGQLANSFTGGTSGMDVNYVPDGNAVILDLVEPYYICQGDYPVQRGDETYYGDPPKLCTISSHGCMDCSFTMAASYIRGEKLDIEKISASRSKAYGFVDGQSFYYSEFASQMELDYSERQGADLSDIINSLNEGFPYEIEMTGEWKSADGSITYHNNSPEHHFLIYGYDETGLYIADPGSRNNTKIGGTARVIPYDDFYYLTVRKSRKIYTSNGYIPKFVINTYE